MKKLALLFLLTSCDPITGYNGISGEYILRSYDHIPMPATFKSDSISYAQITSGGIRLWNDSTFHDVLSYRKVYREQVIIYTDTFSGTWTFRNDSVIFNYDGLIYDGIIRNDTLVLRWANKNGVIKPFIYRR